VSLSLRYEEIAEILKAIDSSSCDELVVETGDVRIVVRRNGATGAPAPIREVSARTAAITAAPTDFAWPVSATSASTTPIEASVDQVVITAPMVGTFYRAPSPDAPPFVEIGHTVQKGQAVCVIEVMKLFTTINAEHDGRVVQIGAQNGDLVEFGQTLFVIEPVK
jgi:acetyl-CoA carboxylase biotin carboxyl carrier protein